MSHGHKPMEVRLKPHLKGFISGVVNSSVKQRAFVEVREEDGTPMTSTTFEGQGKRVPMNTSDNDPNWSFGPFDQSMKAVVYITIYHEDGASHKFAHSKMVGPISIIKEPESEYPMQMHISTVISHHGDVVSCDNCTISVVQYKD